MPHSIIYSPKNKMLILSQFVGDLLVEDIFDGKGTDDFAGLAFESP